ncbi:MAG: family 78 glycoside hydrolase catalytic domain [Tyzzerella sp.]|nr:family 78 glycoside hydrolase catalytic domain [Tyzzerella sp.]
MRIYNCKTNHIVNPIGFAMEHATVSWITESDISKEQVRAQVTVTLDRKMQQVIYTSNPDASLNSTGVKLPITLKPRTRYYWTVQVWGDAGDTAISEVNFFEIGKREEELLGEWITTPWSNANQSPYIKKTFDVKDVKKARLYMTGLGLYHLEVNGQKVGEEYLAPGCTSVDRLVQIYTYDITDLLTNGSNVIGVMMGNGWAKGRFGASSRYHRYQTPFIDRYLLKAELRLTMSDGSETIVTTDKSWKCAPAPVIADSIYDGEVYDERKVITGWSCAACPDSTWDYVKIMDVLKRGAYEELAEKASNGETVKIGKLEDRLSLPIVVKETRKPVEIIYTPIGETVLDLGQNMTGWIRMRIHEPVGTVIKLKYGEILQDGCFYNENLRTAKAEYVYISDGTEKIVEPHFTFYGFRYVKVEGSTKPLNIDDFTGCVVYSDLDETGHITISDERINRLFLNAKWSQKDNFLDLPTDCPQRDERMGWTGDAQMFCKTASYNMDTYAFYRKYLRDVWVEQKEQDGMVGHVAPSFFKDLTKVGPFWKGGSCAWGDAVVIIPWTLYEQYGDVAILEECYQSMKMWIDWVVRNNLGPTGLWEHGFKFGDWLALDGDASQEDDRFGGTDTTLVASSYLKYSSGLVAKAAHVLGREEDAAYYQRISDRTKKAVQDAYYTADGKSRVCTQTAHILALAMDLVETEQRGKIAEGLVKLLKENNMHLKTGFVGTPFFCKVLSSEGYSDAAYELLFQNDFPSWLYEVDMGATTIWERWNSVLPDGKILGTGMNSLNHYAYGSIVQWMYEHICGLTVKDAGFKEFLVAPEFTDRFAYVDMQYDSPKGKIAIKWERKEAGYQLYVKVPFDTKALVKVSNTDGEMITLTAGEYIL